MQIIDRATATSKGLSRYFTGKPCAKGHMSERSLRNRECIACALIRSSRDPNKAARSKASSQRNKAKRALAQKQRYWADPDASKQYHRDYRTSRIEKIRRREAAQRTKHAEKRRKYALDRYDRDRDAVRNAAKKWAAANPHKVAARTARRRAAKIQATPTWADLRKIEEFYELAQRLTEETGVPHEVDHIIPLQGRNVCGLHVHNNLQVITKSENSRKRNKVDLDNHSIPVGR